MPRNIVWTSYTFSFFQSLCPPPTPVGKWRSPATPPPERSAAPCRPPLHQQPTLCIPDPPPSTQGAEVTKKNCETRRCLFGHGQSQRSVIQGPPFHPMREAKGHRNGLAWPFSEGIPQQHRSLRRRVCAGVCLRTICLAGYWKARQQTPGGHGAPLRPNPDGSHGCLARPGAWEKTHGPLWLPKWHSCSAWPSPRRLSLCIVSIR